MSNSLHQPELRSIIERLRNAVNIYDDIVWKTRDRLQMIKKYENPSIVEDDREEKPTESATEEINRLISLLNELNEIAERNLQHLKEIV